MLLKLLTLAALAHVSLASTCCMPDTFQFTTLSETRYQNNSVRARVVFAADLRQGKASIFTFTEQGYNNMIYANLRTGRAHINSPPYGCYDMPIDNGILSQLNQSRCLPDQIVGNGSLSIRLADGLNARLFSTRMGNGSVNALVSDSCKPIIVKVSSAEFDSTNIFGDFYSAPQPGVLDLPPACQNATRVNLGRKRHAAVALAYNHSPMFV